MTAAKEETRDVLSLAAVCLLPETRLWGPGLEKQGFVGAWSWLSSTTRWGCGYVYGGIASGETDQRMYASIYGRFTKPDPMAHAILDDPTTWNQYGYVGGDPINNSDSAGLDPDNPDTWNSPPSAPYFCWDSGDETVPGVTCFGNNGPTTSAQGPKQASLQTSYKDARTAFQNDANNLAKKTKWKAPCNADFTALGTTAAAVQAAAGNVVFQNGTNSQALEASLYANTPQAGAAAATFGNMTIGQFQAQNPGTVAQAQLNGNTIYLNASLIDPAAYFQDIGIVLHEVLHNVTGLSDGDIQSAFGLSTNQPSNNITQKLIKDCF